MCKGFYSHTLFIGLLFLTSCVTAPLQQKSDAEFALDASRRIEANLCSPKYYFMAEKTFKRAESFLARKDFNMAKQSFDYARRFAERAELECIIVKREGK